MPVLRLIHTTYEGISKYNGQRSRSKGHLNFNRDMQKMTRNDTFLARVVRDLNSLKFQLPLQCIIHCVSKKVEAYLLYFCDYLVTC